jgi:hypothetical protein
LHAPAVSVALVVDRERNLQTPVDASAQLPPNIPESETSIQQTVAKVGALKMNEGINGQLFNVAVIVLP